MLILTEIIKLVFFIYTVVIGVFYIKGNYFMADETFNMYTQILIPGYLLFMGVMIGYIIGNFLIIKNDIENDEAKSTILTRGYMIGVGIGVLLALIYVFVK